MSMLHPIVAVLIAVAVIGTAVLGWRYRRTRTRGAHEGSDSDQN